jgi:anhydro-N-acetylmuramic acid kinase
MVQKYRVIGTMSGTSVDGLDIVYCEFSWESWDRLEFVILEAATTPYPDGLRKELINSMHLSATDLLALDFQLGEWMGHEISAFIAEHQIPKCLVASHGHTVFHQPEKGLTLQIGNGVKIHQQTDYPTVFDFRTLDVCGGGQGAPLVPIGDQLLFGSYGGCINIGGFANISFQDGSDRVAFDICPTNIVLNELTESMGMAYDHGGGIARANQVIPELLVQLNELAFYKTSFPKSLGKEWVEEYIKPILDTFSKYSTEDLITTFTHHMANQICLAIDSIPDLQSNQILVTGGGAFNTYLLELVQNSLVDAVLVVPDKNLINYKEALVFGLMGLLRIHDQNNCLSTVTGSSSDCSSGVVVGSLPHK